MKIKDFFENRFGYCPIIVELMDSDCKCTDIYTEAEKGYISNKEEENFLNFYGECICSGWCMVENDGETYLLLRIEKEVNK